MQRETEWKLYHYLEELHKLLTDDNPEIVNDLKNVYVEGASGFIQSKGPVEYSLSMLLNNIKSAMSYSGSEDLASFRDNSTYIEVSSMSNLESDKRI